MLTGYARIDVTEKLWTENGVYFGALVASTGDYAHRYYGVNANKIPKLLYSYCNYNGFTKIEEGKWKCRVCFKLIINIDTIYERFYDKRDIQNLFQRKIEPVRELII